jgi:hypothetical protein
VFCFSFKENIRPWRTNEHRHQWRTSEHRRYRSTLRGILEGSRGDKNIGW